jgi:hypothetical protein
MYKQHFSASSGHIFEVFCQSIRAHSNSPAEAFGQNDILIAVGGAVSVQHEFSSIKRTMGVHFISGQSSIACPGLAGLDHSGPESIIQKTQRWRQVFS